MDLNMTNLWFDGKESAASFPQAQQAAINCRNEELAASAMNLGCMGSTEIAQNSRKSFQQGNQSLAVPDDGCRLVLGLGPTPNLYSADSHSFGGKKAYESATLLTQHCATTSPGLMLGLPRCSSRNLQPAAASGSKNYSHARKTGIVFPIIDEGSTSAKRKPGGYMLPLLFAPRSDDLCLNGTSPDTDIQQHDGIGCDTESDHYRSLNHNEVQPSPDLSITIDCSFAATSDMVVGTTSGEQRSHQRHPKKCRFNGCSKGARGASGLCISHGGGQRCQKPGCNKGAESRTAHCKAHGGGKRCQELGCTKSAEGKTEFCIAHGGGRRCGIEGCSRAARGKSGFCTRSAEGYPGNKPCLELGSIENFMHEMVKPTELMRKEIASQQRYLGFQFPYFLHSKTEAANDAKFKTV